jgi:NOL1/NOP2/fmu family ribosome biogenesis protein
MIQILNQKQIQESYRSLKEQFGIDKIPGRIMKLGEEKLFLFTGDATDEEIKKLENIVPVERLGVYFAKIIKEDVKLSIEGSQILKEQIKNNIFELNDEQAEKWMMGQELNLKSGKRGFVVMKYQDNFLGCGKASEEKISNFIPKMRRLKNREVRI